MGGLIYAIALNPLDLAHLVHNGCDKGLEGFQISIWMQGLEDVGEVEAWVAEGHLHQQLLKNSRANPARLVGQLRGKLFLVAVKVDLALHQITLPRR